MTSPLGLVVASSFILPASISAIADEVARSLAYAKPATEAPTIVTPLLYPGGSRVVLTLREDRGSYFITDGGHGAREADLLGGARIFTRIARELAEANGIRFDSDLIFDIEVPKEALVTAAIMVANTSKIAVETTAQRLANRRFELSIDKLALQFDRQFGSHRVVRDAIVKGATGEWELDLLIKTQGRPALIELVAANANAVNSSVTKFFDISRLSDSEGFNRYSVLIDAKQTPNIGVLGATSRLVEFDRAVSAVSSVAA